MTQPKTWTAAFRSLYATKCDTTCAPPVRTLLPTRSSNYPPISSIPRTSPSRLAESALPSSSPDALFEAPTPADPDEFTPVPDSPPTPKTVLYLAYGSNLSAETFLGVRGIRPISQINVAAPSLRLTFDLPGTPYAEPCFANTAVRRIPKVPPKIPDVPDLPHPPFTATQHGDPTWDAGLIGVVYEVTLADYAHIVETEGAGVAYQDVLVPCAALPPSVAVPEKPPVPELPRPFLAHTLLAPTHIPGEDDFHDERITRSFCPSSAHDGDDSNPPPTIPKWALKFLRPISRPDPEYAQPSARYLKLITDGAREHDLPQDYQEWLQSLHAYKRTTFRQELGQMLITVLFMPLLGIVFGLTKVVADDKGHLPLWLAVMMGALFKSIWWTYDAVLKPVFGDGERTIEGEGDDGRRRSAATWERANTLDEKRGLLGA